MIKGINRLAPPPHAGHQTGSVGVRGVMLVDIIWTQAVEMWDLPLGNKTS